MIESRRIKSPDDRALDDLCQLLAENADQLDASGSWPSEQLSECARYGVYEWFMPQEVGGQNWSDIDIIRGYLRLSAACLTTTFVITQRTGACQRVAGSGNGQLKKELLPQLIRGDMFATVGVSHLTTSRRHLARPVLRAEEAGEDFILDGYSPWVTGANHAEVIVTGATLEDGRQILIALPTDLPGVEVPEPASLVGVSSSHTGQVNCHQVCVPNKWLLAGPIEDVMALGKGGSSGGLQTSTLAIGHTSGSVAFLEQQARKRPDLNDVAQQLREEQTQLEQDLLAVATGDLVCGTEEIRVRANSLVLRASQAALAAAKGTGYIKGHPAGRFCREALFFLVWSCPQAVMAANLCEFAGIEA